MISYLNAWESVLINRSNRPVLDEDEVTLYVKDNIGLYQGKSKILGRQQGRVYLTSKRILYCDNANNSNSVGINLNNVVGSEAIDGFLRSSPKVKVFLRSSLISDLEGKSEGKPKDTVKIVTWLCRICSYNNQIRSDFDLTGAEVPKCTSCGVPTTMDLIRNSIKKNSAPTANPVEVVEPTRRDDQCPNCTFINHPSMKYCELCGSELKSAIPKSLQNKLQKDLKRPSPPLEDPNKLGLILEGPEIYTQDLPYVKLSFRKGGELKFREALGSALDDLAWKRLEKKGAVNKNGVKLKVHDSFDSNVDGESSGGSFLKPTGTGGGIFALQKLGEQQRKRNEIVLSSSLDDLEQLMFKSQDLIKLSDSFGRLIKASNHNPQYASAAIIPPLNIKKSSSLYHQELARHMSEYLVNNELTKVYSIITAQDCFAKYNRYLILTQGFGTELINPTDFKKAIDMLELLSLPIESKYYEKSDLNVLTLKNQSSNSYQQFIVNFLLEQEQQFKYNKMKNEILGITDILINREFAYFKGNTISEISHKLSWSVSITIEEIDKSIEEGSIVIDHNIAGTFYFINRFSLQEADDSEAELRNKIEEEIVLEQQNITSNLKIRYDTDSASNLINLTPDYTFGQLEAPSVSTSPPASSETSSTLNDLNGLSFS